MYQTPSFNFVRENSPNPDVLLNSIRKAGYSLEAAVGDLADNPLDAHADTIIISIRKVENDWDVRVADNGTGMDDSKLDQMLRLGSKAIHDPSRDLGLYGVGSTTASLSLGRSLHVVSRTAPNHTLSGATDLDVVIKVNAFVKHMADATHDEIELFESTFSEADITPPSSGTLVRITRCDLFPYRDERKAVREVKEYVAETYRYFIDAGKRFIVNGEEVAARDPLERAYSDTRILFNDVVEYDFPKGHQRYGEREGIGIILVELPLHGGENEESLHGISMRNQGLYVLRNRRQIVRAETLGMYTRHNQFNRFRGELFFPGTMDDDLGVSFLKSSYRINMTQSLKDKIEEVVRPYLRQVQKSTRLSSGLIDDSINHEDSERLIQRRSPFLRQPSALSATRDSSKKEHDGTVEPKDTGRIQTPMEPRSKPALSDRARFVTEPGDPRAPFFEWELDGKVMVIKYNSNHPFYSRFLVEQSDNPSMVSAVDYLAYSLATAEANSWSEDTYKFIAKMREDLSFNLRQLLAI